MLSLNNVINKALRWIGDLVDEEKFKQKNDDEEESDDFDFMLWKAGLNKNLFSFWNSLLNDIQEV